ncbi:YfdQ family protein [Pectobacterium parmentieri]|uniref:YfdQ family protein n=1 Tax=Pectobacterium parmentieri TaxID=1905730 RepID=UPI001F096E74|nr:DUF2303 family protein [Pectobacterium parmentieri]
MSEIRNLAISAHTPATQIPSIVVPRDHEVVSLERNQLQPSLINQKVNMVAVHSLIAYVSRFSDLRSVIFADNTKTRVVAVLDYHASPESPQWGNHKAVYDCPYSKEWNEWVAGNKSAKGQADFAEFIENHIGDIAPVSDTYVGPAGSSLLEMVLEFQETRQSQFKSVRRLQDGTFQMSYSDEKNGGGNTILPEKISLAIAPFHNGSPYQVDARIRYRLRDGQLVLWYELIEPEKIVEHAFTQIITDLQNALPNVPVYEGSI